MAKCKALTGSAVKELIEVLKNTTESLSAEWTTGCEIQNVQQ